MVERTKGRKKERRTADETGGHPVLGATFVCGMLMLKRHFDSLRRQSGQQVYLMSARPTKSGWAVAYRVGDCDTVHGMAVNTSNGVMCEVPPTWVAYPPPLSPPLSARVTARLALFG
jgi:hypothetical protein